MAYDEVHDYFQEEYNRSTRWHLGGERGEEEGENSACAMCARG